MHLRKFVGKQPSPLPPAPGFDGPDCFKALVVHKAGPSQAEGAGGARAPPPLFGRSVNPIPTGGGGHIIPTQYYVPPKIFRPCDGPARDAENYLVCR